MRNKIDADTKVYHDAVWERNLTMFGDKYPRKLLKKGFADWKSGKHDNYAKRNGGLLSNGIKVILLNSTDTRNLYPVTKLFFNDKHYTLMCIKRKTKDERQTS